SPASRLSLAQDNRAYDGVRSATTLEVAQWSSAISATSSPSPRSGALSTPPAACVSHNPPYRNRSTTSKGSWEWPCSIGYRVSSKSEAETYQSRHEGQVDVASIFIAEWPVAGFDAMRLVDCTTKGVLLPASHPLAARPSVRLEELRSLTWLQPAPQRWPGFIRTMREALRDRGLVPVRSRERSKESPTANVH